MKKIEQKSHILSAFLFLYLLITIPNFAQDPTKDDPKHYKVELENDQVRVIRITYGPGEKSVMHEHAEGVVVMLSNGKTKFNLPDGTSITSNSKKGETSMAKATKHLPHNIADKPMEAILIELKKTKVH